MRPFRGFMVILVALGAWTGCLSTSIDEEWRAPGFGWDTLKRDWILMTPLLDLRARRIAPAGHEQALDFPDGRQSAVAAEAFKRVFAHLRNDIRIFGAGGAFEKVSQLPQLASLGQQILDKTPLSEKDRLLIEERNQDLRFLLVLAATQEELKYDLSYHFRSDQEDDTLTYFATRMLRVQMALWDSKTNQTLWIASKNLTRSANHSVDVRNASKTKKVIKRKDGKTTIEWVGQYLHPTLSQELALRKERFPAFPSRDGLIESSFQDFALSLPIDPSEQKLLEYSYFTFHRPALSVGMSRLGHHNVGEFGLEFSSIIANRYRLGGFLARTSAAQVDFDQERYDIMASAFGLSADREWTLEENLRLLTGATLGLRSYAIMPHIDAPLDAEDDQAKHDASLLFMPRIRVLIGAQQGFQWGAGLGYRILPGIDDELLEAHRPSPWTIELALSYTVRGF